MKVEMHPALQEWMRRPKTRQFLDERFPKHVAVKIWQRADGDRIADVIREVVPSAQRAYSFGGYMFVPFDSLPDIAARLDDVEGTLFVRYLREAAAYCEGEWVDGTWVPREGLCCEALGEVN